MSEVQVLVLDLLSRTTATLLGLFLFIVTTISLLRTVVVPRAMTSAISDFLANRVTNIHRFIAHRRKTYVGRDAVMAWNGPLIIVTQLASWLLLYFVAYGLWIYGIGGVNFGNAFRESGSSLFTLGFSDSPESGPTILAFMAAATGPIVIALLIGFLPTIYGAYVDREINVTLMGVAGGQPSWGPEFIARLTLNEQLAELPTRLGNWTQWFGSLRLTHTTYPVLLQIRSSSPYRHWLVSALTVMDAASLQLALTKKLPRAQCSELLTHGTQTFEILYASVMVKKKLRNRLPFLGKYFGAPTPSSQKMERMPGYRPESIAVEMAATADSTRGYSATAVNLIRSGEAQKIQLPRADFDSAVAMLKEAGYPIEVDNDTAWEQFSISRLRYEFTAYELCRVLDAVPAPWSGKRNRETPTIMPASAVELLNNTTHHHTENQQSELLESKLLAPTQLDTEPLESKRLAGSPDESSTTNEPDAPRQ